jgi:hypothetical protein
MAIGLMPSAQRWRLLQGKVCFRQEGESEAGPSNGADRTKPPKAPETGSIRQLPLFHVKQSCRTFATSGIWGYVDFSVNDHEMGTEFSIARLAEPRRIKIAVAAPERIVKIEIVRNGEAIKDLADGQWFFEGEWIDDTPVPEGAFYYLRIVVTLFSRPGAADAPPAATTPVAFSGGVVLAVATVLLVWLGSGPEPLVRLIQSIAG